MELTLKRPICFFDLETTGINITKDINFGLKKSNL